MIWHIFRKDLRRLWPFVAALTALCCVVAMARVKMGAFNYDYTALYQISEILSLLSEMLAFFLTVAAVQLEALPDDRQDWLVRPIRRRDLLLAKLAFVVILVHGPMFTVHLVQGLADGFAFGAALAAAAAFILFEMAKVTVPALAVAVVTRSIGQAVGLSLIVFIAIQATVMATLWFTQTVPDPGLSGWVLRNGLLLAGAVIILAVQYFRRHTLKARVLMGIFLVLAVASNGMPLSAAMAMQGLLLPVPDVSLAFAPQAGKAAPGAPGREADQNVRIALPLKAEGLPPDLMLVGETVKAILIASNGDRKEINGAQDSVLRLPGRPDASFHQILQVPKEFLRAHAGQPIRVELHYLLGVLRPVGEKTIPASGGAFQFGGNAHCTSRINPAGTLAQVGCLQVGNVHDRISGNLVDREGKVRGITAIRHLPSDAPWSNGSDMIIPVGLSLPLPDDNGMPKVAVTMSRSVGHLLRQVTIPAVRLDDWKVQSAITEGRYHDQDH